MKKPPNGGFSGHFVNCLPDQSDLLKIRIAQG